jgi:hypothetical protein
MRGSGVESDPWVLKPPPGGSEYEVYRDEGADPPALVCAVGDTTLSYQLRCLEDLQAMLKEAVRIFFGEGGMDRSFADCP